MGRFFNWLDPQKSQLTLTCQPLHFTFLWNNQGASIFLVSTFSLNGPPSSDRSFSTLYHHALTFNFYAGRTFRDLQDINEQARHWCTEVATKRRYPGEPDITVRDAFEQEREVLRTPQSCYDLNDYTVPHEYVC